MDLKAQYAEIREEVEAAVREVLESQLFRGGPQVDSFEAEMAAYTGCGHATGVPRARTPCISSSAPSS